MSHYTPATTIISVDNFNQKDHYTNIKLTIILPLEATQILHIAKLELTQHTFHNVPTHMLGISTDFSLTYKLNELKMLKITSST